MSRTKRTVFNFDKHRRIEHYGLITERTGAVLPPENRVRRPAWSADG